MKNLKNIWLSKSKLEDLLNSELFRRKTKTTVNYSLREFSSKEDYPWHLTIKVKAKVKAEYLFSDLKKIEDEDFIQKTVKKELCKLIKSHCTFKRVSNVKGLGYTIYHWYLECPSIDYATSKTIIDEIKQLANIHFSINKDPQWNDMSVFFKGA